MAINTTSHNVIYWLHSFSLSLFFSFSSHRCSSILSSIADETHLGWWISILIPLWVRHTYPSFVTAAAVSSHLDPLFAVRLSPVVVVLHARMFGEHIAGWHSAIGKRPSHSITSSVPRSVGWGGLSVLQTLCMKHGHEHRCLCLPSCWMMQSGGAFIPLDTTKCLVYIQLSKSMTTQWRANTVYEIFLMRFAKQFLLLRISESEDVTSHSWCEMENIENHIRFIYFILECVRQTTTTTTDHTINTYRSMLLLLWGISYGSHEGEKKICHEDMPWFWVDISTVVSATPKIVSAFLRCRREMSGICVTYRNRNEGEELHSSSWR